jgi:hypothetical protein
MFRRKPTRGPTWPAGLAGAVTALSLLAVGCGTGGVSADVAAERAFVVASAPAPATTSSSTTSTTAAPTTVPPTTVPPTTVPPTTVPPSPPPAPEVKPAAVAPAAASGGAYCIGDSVMVGAGPRLFDTLSMCSVVDAIESRQMRNGSGAAAAGAASGAPVVVVHLGTNGPVTAAHVEGVLGPLSNVPRVVLVTIQTSGTRAHQGPVNAELRVAAARHGNVRIADFEAASTGRADYFGTDGIHLSRAGAVAFAQVIAGAMG